MAQHVIVAARPKNASNHVNSHFKMYRFNQKENVWDEAGWKSIAGVNEIIQAGHNVVTGKIENNEMLVGAPVEIELRISKNNTNYKISDMPDA